MKWSSLLSLILIIIVIIGGWIIVIIIKWPNPGPWCLSCPPILKTLGGALILAGLAGLVSINKFRDEARQNKN